MQSSGQHEVSRSGRLQRALAQLENLGLIRSQVRRVTIESGADIHLEVDAGARQRWFLYQLDQLTELQPIEDARIPFAAALANGEIAAGQTIISYRPGRRIVLGPGTQVTGHFVKAYRKGRSARAAQNQTTALSACRRGTFVVPDIVKYERGLDYLVMTGLRGRRPGITLASVAAWWQTGVCLNFFQCARVVSELPEFSSLDELAVLDERARRFLLCVPALPRHWRSGREGLHQAVQGLPPVLTGLTHRDLHDGQLLVAGERIGLMDFDLLCRADVALDAANLLAHLTLRTMQSGDAEGLKACSEAFLAGVGRMDEPGFTQRLYFYQATTYFRLALLYALRPRWAHLTTELINRGGQCINALQEQGHRT